MFNLFGYYLAAPAPAEYSRAWAKGKTNNFAVSIKNARLTVDGVEKEVPVEGATFLSGNQMHLKMFNPPLSPRQDTTFL